MRAWVRDVYGGPSVVRLDDVPRPSIADDQLLVRVHAAAVNKGDTEILLGSPAWVRLFGFGLRQPKIRILGTNVAGTVEAVGSSVTKFAVGDELFGDLLDCGLGGFAEYVAVPESAALAIKPPSLTFEQAASLPEAGFIAIQGLEGNGGIKSGDSVLINGGGGGAGSFAIQLAKSIGAQVTAVDRSDKLEWMRSLGADEVIDYRGSELAGIGERFDKILDVVGAHSISFWKPKLRDGGVYVSAGGSLRKILQILAAGAFHSAVSKKQLGMLAVQQNVEGLDRISQLIESGAVRASVEHRFEFEQAREALQLVIDGAARGRVVITV